MIPGLSSYRVKTRTVSPEEVIKQLEEREAVPALRRLDLQGSIHVYSIHGQEVLSMLHHEVCPPGEGLRRHQGRRVNSEPSQDRALQAEARQGGEGRVGRREAQINGS